MDETTDNLCVEQVSISFNMFNSEGTFHLEHPITI